MDRWDSRMKEIKKRSISSGKQIEYHQHEKVSVKIGQKLRRKSSVNTCPECDMLIQGIPTYVMHLNDSHGWDFERIANDEVVQSTEIRSS